MEINRDRFKIIWKLLVQMHNMEDYSHVFSSGASTDTMWSYLNKWRNKLGMYPVSKYELKCTLRAAVNMGWLNKVPRSVIHLGTQYKLPSMYIFLK